jgi:hypothetical protein
MKLKKNQFKKSSKANSIKKTTNKKTREHPGHLQNQLKIQQKHYKRSKTPL